MSHKNTNRGTGVNASVRSTVIVPSKNAVSLEKLEGVEETEIAAQITVPHEGGWGWVVVFAAFTSTAILDSGAYTFGALFTDLTADIQSSPSAVACINSIAQTMYFLQAPVVSAFINRFGFRAACMTGSAMVSFALLCAYYSKSYFTVFFFYGVMAGTGYCFINLSTLIVGFYFEKLRAVAFSIMSCGSCAGIMAFYPINSYIVKHAGWRVLILMQSGLYAISYFLGMAYRPLLSVTVTKTEIYSSEATRTVTYLPSLKNIPDVEVKAGQSAILNALPATPTEKLFSAVANINYPTAAAVVKEISATSQPTQPQTSQTVSQTSPPGPSVVRSSQHSRYTVTAQSAPGGMSKFHLSQVKSMMSKQSVNDKNKRLSVAEVKPTEEVKKSGCWARLCTWEEHVPQARPMYRDDAFYDGKLKNLPAYTKSMKDIRPESQTGLEYQLAVTRTASLADIQERRGLFTKAARRILSTMVSPYLLKKTSFRFMCTSGFFLTIGYGAPYVFVQDRGLFYGIDPSHCALFVSAMGLMSAVGRLSMGAVACKIDPLKLYIAMSVLAGVVTIFSDISHTTVYQYFYSCAYGFFSAPTTSLRSIVLTKLYGLENLTNATGLMLLLQGVGSFICTPSTSIIKEHFGYGAAFIWAGVFMVVSGLFLYPVERLVNKENNET